MLSDKLVIVGEKPLILIVDDARINLHLLENLLKDEYRIKVASDGETALQIARQHPDLALILLDIVMPDMDGYEVCRQLKANPETRDIPVVFVTSSNDDDSEVQGLQLGAVDYISKPIKPLITKLRVQKHISIRQYQQRLYLTSKIIQNCNEAVLVVDTAGIIIDVNPTFSKITGYQSYEVVGQPIQFLNSGIQRPEAYNHIWQELSLVGRWSGELQNRRKNGEVYYEWISYFAILDAKNTVSHYVGIASDITLLKDRESHLKKSEQLLRESQRNAKIGSYIIDVQSGICDNTSTLNDLFGLPEDYPNTINGWLALLHPDFTDSISNYLQEVISRGNIFDAEFKIIRPNDGDERWMHGLGQIIFDSQGNRSNLMGTVQDITERKMTEKRLETQKNLYAALSKINETILHTADESHLFDEICRITVETGLMKLASIGRQDPETHEIIPLAIHGKLPVTADSLFLSAESQQIPEFSQKAQPDSDSENPANRVIGSELELTQSRFNKALNQTSFSSSVCFPILRNDKCYAVFTVYHTEEDVLNDEIVSLLNAMVNDIDFALTAIETKNSLIQSEERSRLLLESVNSGIWGMGFDGRITFANQAAAKMLGYQQQQLIGCLSHALFHHSYPDGSAYPEECCPIIETLKDGEERQLSNEVFWRQDGSSFPVEYSTHPIIKDQALIGAVVVFQDITQRKESESNLLSIQDHLQSTLNAIPDLMFEWGLDGYIYSYSTTRHDLLFTEPNQFLGKRLQDFLPQEAAQICLQATKDADALGSSNNWQYQLLIHDELKWFELSISRMSRLHSDGPHFIAIARDITDRKMAEIELTNQRETLEDIVLDRTKELIFAKDLAEAANRAKSDFVSNISHEVRTPLNAVLGMTHLALQSEQSPKQRDYLLKIGHAGQHLLALVNDILDFSKIEAGKLEVEIAPLSIHELLNDLKKLLGNKVTEKGLHMPISVESDVPDIVQGDRQRILQILINFCSNALKFTEQGSIAINIRAEGEKSNKVSLLFEVTDTGIGLTEHAKERLFKAFTQENASISRKYGGTGLGLAICKQLAQLMGGSVGVNSQLGVGSTFWLRLDLAPGIKDLDDTFKDYFYVDINATRAMLGGKKILLAEDNLFNQQITKEILEIAGISVVLARHGGEAIECLKYEQFDAVLMDIQMPEMDGLQATLMIRSELAYPDLPIIAMTANSSSEDIDHCMNVGMNDFISKPVRPMVLYETLSRWVAAKMDDSLTNPSIENDAEINSDGSGLLNIRFLTEIVGEDAVKIAELLQLFVEVSDIYLEEATQALSVKDARSLCSEVHKIKSSSRSVGADRLGAVCEEIEQLTKNIDTLDWSLIGQLFQQMLAMYGLLKNEILQYRY